MGRTLRILKFLKRRKTVSQTHTLCHSGTVALCLIKNIFTHLFRAALINFPWQCVALLERGIGPDGYDGVRQIFGLTTLSCRLLMDLKKTC